MSELQRLFPALTHHSDINWDAVTAEYQQVAIHLSFPEYLQYKAEEGDCPAHLFELAYFELALNDARNSEAVFPHLPGVYLNPTALFLSLEYQIEDLTRTTAQQTEILERPHVCAVFRDIHDEVHALDVSDEALRLLGALENGPQPDTTFADEQKPLFDQLVAQGLILNLHS